MAELPPIDRLWQGMSDQPPWVRSPGQVENALNVRHDVILAGSAKRAATLLKADLSPLTAGKDYLFESIRDAVVAIGEDEIFAFNTLGQAFTVVDSSTTTPFNEYLRHPTGGTFDPYTQLEVTVSQNTLIILNRLKNTATEAAFSSQESLNFIITGDKTDGSHGITINIIGSFDRFSDLPAVPANGDRAFVNIDENLDPHGFYVRFDGTPFNQTIFPEHDNWFRIPASGQFAGRYTPSTMPHRLFRSGSILTFSEIEWSQRLNGNNGSSPRMPFVGGDLKSCLFQHARLFLLDASSVNASRSGDPFNLWDNSAGNPVADDRISIDVREENVGDVLRAVQCGDHILIGTENAQLQFGSGAEPLTNANGRIRQLTDFKTQDVFLGSSGNRSALIDERGRLHHYIWVGEDLGGIRYAGNMASHIRSIIRDRTPRRVLMATNATFITTLDDDVIGHDHFTPGEGIIQSAFGFLRFFGTGVWMNEFADVFRVVTQDATGYSLLHYFHEEPPKSGSLDYQVHLDRQEGAVGTYEGETTDITRFQHTGRNGDLSTSRLVLNSDVADVGEAHVELLPVDVDGGGDIGFQGNITGSHFLGFTYRQEIETSKVFPKLAAMEFNVNSFTVFHFDSTGYEAIVESREGSDRSKPADILDGNKTRTFYFEFVGMNLDIRRKALKLRSQAAGPVIWTAIKFEGLAGGRV